MSTVVFSKASSVITIAGITLPYRSAKLIGKVGRFRGQLFEQGATLLSTK